jgi:hypothetical protein
MLTKKHLEALAIACADLERSSGWDAHHASHVIMARLISEGVVTPRFDRGRFAQAVEDARPIPFAVAG